MMKCPNILLLRARTGLPAASLISKIAPFTIFPSLSKIWPTTVLATVGGLGGAATIANWAALPETDCPITVWATTDVFISGVAATGAGFSSITTFGANPRVPTEVGMEKGISRGPLGAEGPGIPGAAVPPPPKSWVTEERNVFSASSSLEKTVPAGEVTATNPPAVFPGVGAIPVGAASA